MELQRWSWIHGWLFSVCLFVCRPPLLSTHRSISLRVHVGPPHPLVFLDPRVGAWSRRWPCYPMLQRWRRTWWIVRPGRRLLPLSSLQHSAPVRWIDRLSYTVRATAFNSQYNQQVLICFYFLIHISHICEVVWPFPHVASSCSELFTTEVSHLRTLRVLDQVFYQKMRTVLNSDELACIFPNLPQVYELHGQCLSTIAAKGLWKCLYTGLVVTF